MKNLKNRLLLTIPIFVVAIYYGYRTIIIDDVLPRTEYWIVIIFPAIWVLLISILDAAILKNKL